MGDDEVRISEMSLMTGWEYAALVAHPDAELTYGEQWTCSCGQTILTFSNPTTFMGQPMEQTAWCPSCNDLAIWRVDGIATEPARAPDQQ